MFYLKLFLPCKIALQGRIEGSIVLNLLHEKQSAPPLLALLEVKLFPIILDKYVLSIFMAPPEPLLA
jgi:hypothetical protein